METGLTVGRKRMTPRTRKIGGGRGLYLSREKKGVVTAYGMLYPWFLLRDSRMHTSRMEVPAQRNRYNIAPNILEKEQNLKPNSRP